KGEVRLRLHRVLVCIGPDWEIGRINGAPHPAGSSGREGHTRSTIMKRYRMALAGALLAVALHAPSALAQWGSLSGQFVFDGTAPARAPLSITKDVEFCGKHDLKSDALVVNPEN